MNLLQNESGNYMIEVLVGLAVEYTFHCINWKKANLSFLNLKVKKTHLQTLLRLGKVRFD